MNRIILGVEEIINNAAPGTFSPLDRDKWKLLLVGMLQLLVTDWEGGYLQIVQFI